MATRKRVDGRLAGDREAQAIAATLGAQAASTRRSLRLGQATVAVRCGISRSRLGDLERGQGEGAPLGLWVALGLVLGRPLRVELSRAIGTDTADAGHLAIQELVLRLGRGAGYGRGFEVPTRPTDPARSTDVGLRDDARRTLVLVECWNTIGDVGAAARATSRKLAEAEALAIAQGGERPFTVAACGSSGQPLATGPSWPATRRSSPPASRAHPPVGQRPSPMARSRPRSPGSCGATSARSASSPGAAAPERRRDGQRPRREGRRAER